LAAPQRFVCHSKQTPPPRTAMENYTVENHLGAGNYGEVSTVRAKKTGQIFVCKKVDLSSKTPQQQKDAENEVRIMSKVTHPNIIGFMAAFVENRVLHIIMEYADGTDLEKKLSEHAKNKKPLTQDQILDIFVQICLALRQLHKQHLMHRDLKSANVFLTAAGAVKLGDFGFSKQLTYTMALASTICGTPYYFSPELCQKLPYNNKNDVWALGVLLYEMINLKKPFEARNLPELRKRVVTEDPSPMVPNVSDELKSLCMSMLRKSSSTRPSVEMVLQTPIVRKHLATMSHAMETAADVARQRATTIKAANPRRDSEVEVSKPVMSAQCMAHGKFDRNQMKALTQEAAKAPAPPAKMNSDQLHNRPLPDARTKISINAPIDIVSDLSNAMVQEEDFKFLKNEMEQVLTSFEVTSDGTLQTEESLGEAQTDDERMLRDELGEDLFMKALQLVLLINTEHGTPEGEKHFGELLQLMGPKAHLVSDLQRVSHSFEIEHE
jgi:serine/threonine protein kinase